jgi:hypothetical protein
MRKGIKLKQNKKYETVGTVPKVNRKTLETEARRYL